MTNEEKVKVWDVAVRFFHWTLVVLFAAAYVSGDEAEQLHIYAGYGVLGVVLFRIVWAFVGSRYARFSDLIYGPRATLRYAFSLISGRPIFYLGHNPLGGWMALLLLTALLAVSWSGLKLYGAEGQGPLASQEGISILAAMANDEEKDHEREHKKEHEKEANGDELWEEAHEVLANLTLFLVLVHIAGALISSALHRENLIWAMVTGYKRRPPES